MCEKSKQLDREIRDKKHEGKFSSKKELHRELYKLGDIATKEENFYLAINAYIELNDRNKVKELGNICLKDSSWLYDAQNAFEFLRDREGLSKVLKIAEKKRPELFSSAIKSYIGEKTIKTTLDKFEEWGFKKGYNHAVTIGIIDTINMGYNLSGKYNLGIGIAKGGLFSTYIFSLFGLKTGLVEAHRNTSRTTFKWIDDNLSKKIDGQKILVFDKDVITGRTTKRVLNELKKYNPKKIVLVLNHNPIKTGTCGFGTTAKNIPIGYNDVYYPKDFNYKKFDKTVNKLEKKLGV